VVAWLRLIEQGDAVPLKISFKRYRRCLSGQREINRFWNEELSHGTIRFHGRGTEQSFEIDLDTYSTLMALCSATWAPNEDDFLALSMLSRIAPRSVHNCGNNLVRRLGYIDLADQLDESKRTLRSGPKEPFEYAEFLNRLSDRNALIWFSELRAFLSNMRQHVLKRHLIACGLASKGQTMHGWTCTVAELLDIFAPYVESRPRKREAMNAFLATLQDAGLQGGIARRLVEARTKSRNRSHPPLF
jgi:hypothetical protein